MKTTKKILTILSITTLLFVFSLFANAETYGDLTYTVTDGEVTITESSLFVASVVIPSQIDGYPVTSIGDYAFSYCNNLTSVTLPDSVESIGYAAFYYCTSLTSVTIPDSVTSIGDRAFSSCNNLTSVTIGNSVTSIGDYAFEFCTSLTSVTIGNSVTSIGYSAFENCDSLTQINWNAKNVNDFSLGNFAFAYAGQSGNGINVVFGDSVEKIPACAFCPYSSSDSPKIVSVTIGNNVTSIGDCAFENCDSLASVTIGNGVTSIGFCAFYNCTSLTSITIPDRVTSIGDCAFENCDSLTQINWNAKNVNDFSLENYVFCYAGQNGDGINVIFGDSVEKIPANAFAPLYWSSSYSPKIVSVTIGDSVTSIGYRAFYRCTSLENATIYSRNVAFDDDVFKGYNLILYGYAGSTTEIYGNENDIPFVALEEPGYIPGDVNGDGVVNNRDAARILQYVAGWDVELK